MDTISLCNLCLVSWYLVVFWVKTLILYHLSACALRDAQRTPLAPGSHVRAGARRARAIESSLPLSALALVTVDGRGGDRRILYGYSTVGHLHLMPRGAEEASLIVV